MVNTSEWKLLFIWNDSKIFRMEKYGITKPNKSKQLQNMNTVRWDSRNNTTQPGGIDDRKLEVIVNTQFICLFMCRLSW